MNALLIKGEALVEAKDIQRYLPTKHAIRYPVSLLMMKLLKVSS